MTALRDRARDKIISVAARRVSDRSTREIAREDACHGTITTVEERRTVVNARRNIPGTRYNACNVVRRVELSCL